MTSEQIAEAHIEHLSEEARPYLKRGHEERTLQWVELLIRHFRSNRDVLIGLCIISYESGGNELAANSRSSASGLWQHLGSRWGTRSRRAGVASGSIWDPEAATVVAAWLVYSAGGWRHWTVYLGNCHIH